MKRNMGASDRLARVLGGASLLTCSVLGAAKTLSQRSWVPLWYAL